MIALVLLGVLAQAPQVVVASAAAVEAVAIRGEAELTPAAAFESAHDRVEDCLRERWRERAQRLVVDQRPFWLPVQLAERAVGRWLLQTPIGEGIRVVDREDRTREHEFGSSYQTTLWVTEDPQQVARGSRQLRRELELVTRRTLLTAGGTVVFWATLAFVLGWVDRLSRGYMTGRLRLLGLLLGTAAPTIAFLL